MNTTYHWLLHIYDTKGFLEDTLVFENMAEAVEEAVEWAAENRFDYEFKVRVPPNPLNQEPYLILFNDEHDNCLLEIQRTRVYGAKNWTPKWPSPLTEKQAESIIKGMLEDKIEELEDANR